MNADPNLQLDDAIQAAATILGAVSDVGRVHPYMRFANTEAGVQAMMADPSAVENPKRIRFWTITRSATVAAVVRVGSERDKHTLTIRGWATLNDATNSERDFQLLIERVRAAFRANRTLNDTVWRHDPLQVSVVMSGAIAGFLVHYCELVLAVEMYPIDY